jgi:hypothetical protein
VGGHPWVYHPRLERLRIPVLEQARVGREVVVQDPTDFAADLDRLAAVQIRGGVREDKARVRAALRELRRPAEVEPDADDRNLREADGRRDAVVDPVVDGVQLRSIERCRCG